MRKLLRERKLLWIFSSVSYFREKKQFQRSNQLVQKKEVNKEGRKKYVYKINKQKLHKRTEEISGSQRL